MAESGYLLSEEDAKSLKKIIEEYNIRLPKDRKYYEEEQRFQTPDVYVIKTPSVGIGALTVVDQPGTAEDIGHPGFAECYIYRIGLNDSQTQATLTKISEHKKMVFNLSQVTTLGNIWTVVTKDKMGKWVISNSSVTSEYVSVVTDVCPTFETYNLLVTIAGITGGTWP